MKHLRSFIHGTYVNQGRLNFQKSTGVAVESTSSYVLRDACTSEPHTELTFASSNQVEEAITSSRESQVKWSTQFSLQERCSLIRKTADILREKAKDIARLETMETGRPLAETSTVDIDSAVDCLMYYAGIAPAMTGQTVELGNGSWAYTRREPLGVTAGIGAWNYPLVSAAWKSAPALTFGNSMVFKPSEETPSTALLLAESFIEAGVPEGVFNVLLGSGAVGEALSEHKDISKISFTGSLATGLKVYQNAAKTLKKVTLELGGKSPLLIFDDADIEEAVAGSMLANWYSSGQVCSNGTRVYVHKKVKDQFLCRLIERTKLLKIGHPMDLATDVGPMINQTQMNKVLNYIDIGVQEGATLLYGGCRLRLNDELASGCFLSPAIFDNCTDDMRIVKEEVFGMVVSILTFEDEEDVVQRANDTDYGLSAGVFTRDLKRAHRVIGQIKAGTTWINNYNLAHAQVPWGGYKKSGIGRENGTAGVDSWTQLKSVYVEMGEIDCPYA